MDKRLNGSGWGEREEETVEIPAFMVRRRRPQRSVVIPIEAIVAAAKGEEHRRQRKKIRHYENINSVWQFLTCLGVFIIVLKMILL